MNGDRNQDTRTNVGAIIAAIFECVTRIERRIDDVAEDVNTIDRTLRPYGDGQRTRGRRR
jgi:hypothetical protein